MQQADLYSTSEIEAGRTLAQPRWYAAYTCPRHEKSVAEQLTGRGVEFYLPLYETVSRWKDRRVWLSLPLFPGYVFVRIPLRERLLVLGVPSVVRLVGFNGRPAPLPEEEIESLRNGLSALRAEPYPFLKAGRRVRIVQGPLEGLEGVLLRRKGRYRLVLSLDLIQRSICVDVDADSLRPVGS
jgi:transcription antitermination factor NusG